MDTSLFRSPTWQRLGGLACLAAMLLSNGCAVERHGPWRAPRLPTTVERLPPQAPPETAQGDRARVLLHQEVMQMESASRTGGAGDPTRLASLRVTEDASDRLDSDDFEGALDLLERAITIDSGNGYAYLYLAKAYFRLGDRRRSSEFLERSAVLLPRDYRLDAELAALRRALGDGVSPAAVQR
jgi:tetratricopeptide (TPR) repeat protein